MSLGDFIFVVEFDGITVCDLQNGGSSWLLETLVYVCEFLPVYIQWIGIGQFLNLFMNFINCCCKIPWISRYEISSYKLNEFLFFFADLISGDRLCLIFFLDFICIIKALNLFKVHVYVSIDLCFLVFLICRIR